MADSEIKNKRKKWSLPFCADGVETRAAIAELAKQTGLTEITARLLYARGYQTAEAAARFFRMEEASFHDPFLMKDMHLAVARIERAIDDGERVVIYGDYDVDGVTSVSLLYLYLKHRGAPVDYYIPSRSVEGYGLSNAAIDRLNEKGVDLIVTVDTGITANAEVEYAASLGIDTVVTDHHECRSEIPNACAVVNPHRADDSYPFAELAGVGVVFKVVCALELSRCRKEGIAEIDGIRSICKQYADLVAIGTVADVMPVVDENRLIISMGLRRMETDCRLGLRALMNAASAGRERVGAKNKKINSSYIGFTIAPRMNAAGRVSQASIAVELLLSESRDRAESLAETLCDLNAERQKEENRISEEAYRKIEEMPPEDRSFVVVLDDDTWHQGIIGIVSSRITERYGLPSILISYDGGMDKYPSAQDVGKGSGRSIKGINLVEALGACEDLLVRYGGHELAAGLSVRRGDVAAFRRRINQYAAERLMDEPLCMTLDADCEVEMRDLTMTLAKEIDYLEPFGIANPVPCFILRDVNLLRVSPMGGGKHVRLTVEKDGIMMTAVWFGMGIANLPFETTDQVDLLFQLNVNEFQNQVSLQLIVQDAAVSERAERELSAQIARYEEIRAGGEYAPEEDVLPSRDDVAAVYTFLRREFRAGKTSFPIRRLLGCVRTQNGGSFNYAKMKFILRILQELRICGVSEPVPDHFLVDIFYPNKTNLDKSSILHKLKGQQKKPKL